MYHNYSWKFSLCVFYRIHDEGREVISDWFSEIQMSLPFFSEKCSSVEQDLALAFYPDTLE